jgi:hypothetical protein
MDAFDRFWQWANKPPESTLTIPADIHHAITSLPPEARRDRAKVNEAVRKIEMTEPIGTAIAVTSRLRRSIRWVPVAVAHTIIPGAAVDHVRVQQRGPTLLQTGSVPMNCLPALGRSKKSNGLKLGR